MSALTNPPDSGRRDRRQRRPGNRALKALPGLALSGLFALLAI